MEALVFGEQNIPGQEHFDRNHGMEQGLMDGLFCKIRDTHSALLDLPRYLDDRWGGSGVSLMKLLLQLCSISLFASCLCSGWRLLQLSRLDLSADNGVDCNSLVFLEAAKGSNTTLTVCVPYLS